MKNKIEIERYLKVINRAVKYIEDLLEDDDEIDFQKLLPKKKKKPKPVIEQPVVAETKFLPPKSSITIANREEYVNRILSNNQWPEAFPKHLEAKPDITDQINRANAIINQVLASPPEGANFLDFGCGEGWVAKQMVHRGVKSSVGFDLIPSSYWQNNGDVKFTNVFRDLIPNSFDIILLYDVLDHCEDPLNIMKQVRSLLKKNGTVYVRCHPWTSKHASHLYKSGLNRAYIHLFLTWEELVEHGYTPLFTRIEKNPMEAYRYWFKDFIIENEHIHQCEVDEFFHIPDIKNVLIEEQKPESVPNFYKSMSLEFIDFVLRST